MANAEPIPDRLPTHSPEHTSGKIEDIGQATTACFLTKTLTDPTNW